MTQHIPNNPSSIVSHGYTWEGPNHYVFTHFRSCKVCGAIQSYKESELTPAWSDLDWWLMSKKTPECPGEKSND